MSEMDLHDDDLEPGSDEAAPDTDVTAEAPEADSAEQHRDVRGHGDVLSGALEPDVDPADRSDQQRVVELDEDEYR